MADSSCHICRAEDGNQTISSQSRLMWSLAMALWMRMPRHTHECREPERPEGALEWVLAASHALGIHPELTTHVQH